MDTNANTVPNTNDWIDSTKLYEMIQEEIKQARKTLETIEQITKQLAKGE
jgi:uncharacterized protein YutE (UPF0331/DUF86 family)